MIEMTCGERFIAEADNVFRVLREERVQDLYRDALREVDVFGLVNAAGGACAEEAKEPVLPACEQPSKERVDRIISGWRKTVGKREQASEHGSLLVVERRQAQRKAPLARKPDRFGKDNDWLAMTFDMDRERVSRLLERWRFQSEMRDLTAQNGADRDPEVATRFEADVERREQLVHR
jgi:hypothetical protein